MPQDLLLRGAIARLKQFEQSGSGEEQECAKKTLPARYCVRVIREFIYESDLDKNGVLHYLGTQVGRSFLTRKSNLFGAGGDC